MLTLVTKTSQKHQHGRISNSSVRQAGSSINPVVRRLPHAYAMMNNTSVNESAMQPVRTNEALSHDIYVRINSVFKKIRPKDIYLIEGLCDYVNIYTRDERYTIYSTMHAILKKLPKTDFMRVHRSFIVRLDCISCIEKDMLSVEIRLIPVGKTYKTKVMSKLNLR